MTSTCESGSERLFRARIQPLFARTSLTALVLSVTDDGVGIDAALRERLLEPGATAGAGTGLGLGIARRTARSLGGDVVVEPAERTTFTVRLPVA